MEAKMKIRLLVIGVLAVLPICYLAATRLTHAHAAETAPPNALDADHAKAVDKAIKLDRDLSRIREYSKASAPFLEEATAICEAAHLNFQALLQGGSMGPTIYGMADGTTIDFATGEIKRPQRQASAAPTPETKVAEKK